MTLVDWSRAVCVVLWGGLAIICAPSAWRSLWGRTSANDAWRGLLFFIAMVILLFLGRWFIARSNQDAYVPLQAFSALCALYAIRIVRAYGRGF